MLHLTIPDEGSRAMEIVDKQWVVEFPMQPIRRRKSVIFLCLVFFLALGLGYLSVARPRYTAVAELILDPKRPQAQQSEPITETLVDIAVLESHLETVKSEKIALGVIRNLSLAQDPEFTRIGTVERIAARVVPGWDAESESLQRVLTRFKRALSVRLLGRSYVMEIGFTSYDADKAARIASEVAKVYIQDQLEARIAQSREAGDWLQARISHLREQMTKAFQQMEDLKAENAASSRQGYARLRELEAEAQTYKSMYEAFLNRYVQNVQQQSFPITDTRVVTNPLTPLRPSYPNPLYTMLGALAAGLGLGLLIAFVLERRSRPAR